MNSRHTRKLSRELLLGMTSSLLLVRSLPALIENTEDAVFCSAAVLDGILGHVHLTLTLTDAGFWHFLPASLDWSVCVRPNSRGILTRSVCGMLSHRTDV